MNEHHPRLPRAIDLGGETIELRAMSAADEAAVLVFAQTFVRGALIVLIAVLAVKTLALGASAVGWLNTAIGAGGVAGGIVSVLQT